MEALSAGTAHFPVLISVTVAMRTEAASPAYSSEGHGEEVHEDDEQRNGHDQPE